MISMTGGDSPAQPLEAWPADDVDAREGDGEFRLGEGGVVQRADHEGGEPEGGAGETHEERDAADEEGNEHRQGEGRDGEGEKGAQ